MERDNHNDCTLKLKQGHTKERCYKLVGYPPNNKNYKGKKNVAASVNMEIGEASTSGTSQAPISQDQYTHLLSMIEALKPHGSTANLAGMLTALSHSLIHSLNSFVYNDGIWIIDSGASEHMTYEKKLLQNIRSLDHPCLVSLPTGSQCPSMRKPLELGRAHGGLYLLDSSVSNSVSVQLPDAVPVNSVATPDLDVWHARLGHLPKSKPIHISGQLLLMKQWYVGFDPQTESIFLLIYGSGFIGYLLSIHIMKLYQLSWKLMALVHLLGLIQSITKENG
ncbi:hypothetical protein V2J09_010845 [Rumex salicifolius]